MAEVGFLLVRVSSEPELCPSAGFSSRYLSLDLALVVTAGVVNDDDEEEKEDEEPAGDRGLVSSLGSGGGVDVWSCWKSRWISASERVSDCSPCW